VHSAAPAPSASRSGRLGWWPSRNGLRACCARPSRDSRRPIRSSSSRARPDLGALLRRRNRRIEAREHLTPALDAAHRAGAEPLVERALTELRATGAKPRRILLTGVDALTPSERRVAELAAQGMTNREIAQALFVTARTVEGHLTRVFQKLDLSSRQEVADALAPASDHRVGRVRPGRGP
jgi:DNA-binding CsgD family transcriptional regulator